MHLAVKINVAPREQKCQKIGSERVKLINQYRLDTLHGNRPWCTEISLIVTFPCDPDLDFFCSLMKMHFSLTVFCRPRASGCMTGMMMRGSTVHRCRYTCICHIIPWQHLVFGTWICLDCDDVTFQSTDIPYPEMLKSFETCQSFSVTPKKLFSPNNEMNWNKIYIPSVRMQFCQSKPSDWRISISLIIPLMSVHVQCKCPFEYLMCTGTYKFQTNILTAFFELMHIVFALSVVNFNLCCNFWDIESSYLACSVKSRIWKGHTFLGPKRALFDAKLDSEGTLFCRAAALCRTFTYAVFQSLINYQYMYNHYKKSPSFY